MNDLVSIQNQLPAEVRELLAKQIQADVSRLGAIGGGDVIHVTQDKKFQMPDGTTTESFDAVIVDFVYRNEYYGRAFNPKQITPPACFAINPEAALLSPSPNSPMVQSPNGCSTCQQNQFGSSPTGDGKACKNTVYMAVLPVDATADTPIMVLKSAPTAIRHFNNYVSKLAQTARVPVNAAVTKLKFDEASSYSSLRFETAGANMNYPLAVARQSEARHRLMQEPDVSKFESPTKGGKR